MQNWYSQNIPAGSNGVADAAGGGREVGVLGGTADSVAATICLSCSFGSGVVGLAHAVTMRRERKNIGRRMRSIIQLFRNLIPRADVI